MTAPHEAAQQEQPEQEPVAWRYKAMIGMPWSLSDDGYYISCKRTQGYMVEPLFTHPDARPVRAPKPDHASMPDAPF